jgi:hypothetical protein
MNLNHPAAGLLLVRRTVSQSLWIVHAAAAPETAETLGTIRFQFHQRKS